MKNAIKELEDLRRINAAIEILKDSDEPSVINGLIEGLDAYIDDRLNDMFMYGNLNIEDIKVLRIFIEENSKADAAARYGCSATWFNQLIMEICEQVDSMGKVG